jgi:SEC-C motif domain protein
MRSRYTAHVVRDYPHLHRTFAGTAKKPYVVDPDPMDMDWTRLVIHAHEVDAAKPDQSIVDFSAYYRDEGAERAIHEKSEFKRIDGAWIYTRVLRDGPPPVKAAPKVGRNDPCPCGSGKKFKHCHGR